MNKSEMFVGMVNWGRETELLSNMLDTFQHFGCRTTSFSAKSQLPQGLDLVIAVGPFGSLTPITNQLADYPISRRPKFLLWMTEQLPNPALPEWIRYPVSAARSYVDWLSYRRNEQNQWIEDHRFSRLTSKAYRFRYYGDLFRLKKANILTVLAVGSDWIANYLRVRGLEPVVAYIGSHPSWGEDLGIERDIPVVWIGKFVSSRRRHVFELIRTELRQRGVELKVIDGIENPPVFGHERTVLLNRTKIVLNILREKWDNHSLRYFLAAQNGALIVTEPTLPHTPFQVGKHLVRAEIDHIVDTMMYYLNHEDERLQISKQAYQLVSTELTMKNSVERIIHAINEKS
jgi:hypothetical protein